MSDLQMYILAGIPLVTLSANTALFLHLSSRIDVSKSEVSARIDVLTGKLIDLDNRMVRLETRWERQ